MEGRRAGGGVLGGRSPLHAAAAAGSLREVELLLAEGANVHCASKLVSDHGRLPLHLAVRGDHVQVTRALLQAGANPDTADNQGWRPLHLAALHGHVRMIGLLVKFGANLEYRDGRGLRAVHIAAAHGMLEILRHLYFYGCDLTSKDSRQATALHHAAKGGDVDVVRWLVKKRLPHNIPDEQKKRPIDWARECDNNHVQWYLNSLAKPTNLKKKLDGNYTEPAFGLGRASRESRAPLRFPWHHRLPRPRLSVDRTARDEGGVSSFQPTLKRNFLPYFVSLNNLRWNLDDLPLDASSSRPQLFRSTSVSSLNIEASSIDTTSLFGDESYLSSSTESINELPGLINEVKFVSVSSATPSEPLSSSSSTSASSPPPFTKIFNKPLQPPSQPKSPQALQASALQPPQNQLPRPASPRPPPSRARGHPILKTPPATPDTSLIPTSPSPSISVAVTPTDNPRATSSSPLATSPFATPPTPPIIIPPSPAISTTSTPSNSIPSTPTSSLDQTYSNPSTPTTIFPAIRPSSSRTAPTIISGATTTTTKSGELPPFIRPSFALASGSSLVPQVSGATTVTPLSHTACPNCAVHSAFPSASASRTPRHSSSYPQLSISKAATKKRRRQLWKKIPFLRSTSAPPVTENMTPTETRLKQEVVTKDKRISLLVEKMETLQIELQKMKEVKAEKIEKVEEEEEEKKEHGEAETPEEEGKTRKNSSHSQKIPEGRPVTHGEEDPPADVQPINESGVLNLTVEPPSTADPEGPHIYSCLTNPRGTVLILNNKNFHGNSQMTRYGSELDVINLERIFSQMGYQVQTYWDLTRELTLKYFQEASEDHQLKHVSALFVFILSHGEGYKTFLSHDRARVTLDEIRRCFLDRNCPHLRGKPKVFLSHFCRGSDDEIEEPMVPEAHLEAYKDMLCLYSTTEGFRAYRHGSLGTPFVRAWCTTLAKYAGSHKLDELIKMFQREYKEMRGATTPEVQNFNFNKDFYFNPLNQR